MTTFNTQTHLQWPNKGPTEDLDYQIRWSKLLSGDIIASSTWTAAAGITHHSASFDTTTTTIWLSGGAVGATYSIKNEITTITGRVFDRTVLITIKAK